MTGRGWSRRAGAGSGSTRPFAVSHGPGPRGGRRSRRVRAAWPARRLAVVLLAVAGVGTLLYPSAATWVSARSQAGAVTGWAERVEATPAPVLERLLDRARRYNAGLGPVPLHDPYGEDPGSVSPEDLAAYEDTLAPAGDDVIAVLRIPSIDVDLPIRHGTGTASLRAGVGHLYGTSLPVGGDDTHAVLTAHSGQVGATLFDRLDELSQSDEFQVDVLGESLVYRVDSVRVVLPREMEALARVPGEDHVTLVTCTPTGVNSHRLLVRGHRVPAAEEATGRRTVDGPFGPAGFPWWVLVATAAVVLLPLATRRLAR